MKVSCHQIYCCSRRLSLSGFVCLFQYLRKQTEPAYITVATDAELDAFDDKEGVEVLGIFESLDSAEAKAFLATAEELRNDYSFGVSTNTAFASKFGVSAPALVLFKSEAGADVNVPTADASVLASTATIKTWVNGEAFELVGEIGPENFQARNKRIISVASSFSRQRTLKFAISRRFALPAHPSNSPSRPMLILVLCVLSVFVLPVFLEVPRPRSSPRVDLR